MRMQYSDYPTYLLFGLLFLIGCTAPPDLTDPQYIVDRAIEAHGSTVLNKSHLEFDYRGKHFIATRNDGVFSYERLYSDSTGNVREVLNNDEVFKEINGERVDLTEKKRYSIQETLNSVVYFGFVPFFLNDPAVQKKFLGETIVEDNPYLLVEITFAQEDGGPDYEDRFVYWFHKETFTMDYLAYDFHINDGGTRLRKAYNIRTIEGVRVSDFYNYSSDVLPQPGTPIETYGEVLTRGDAKLLSEINLENVTIRQLE
ncbi:MAG: hypothetical protein KTR29_07520 [Rhodothermaceae bacterium]|nr:hypothetical protein [Rhodothermaceae bacterium]